jgi:uncharacterized membrane protein
MVFIRRYLIAGLLIWAPILVTFLIIEFLLHWFDKLIALIPTNYQPDTLLHVHIPGLSLVVIILVLIVTGILATNVIGRFLVNLGEKILGRIPLVRTIYTSVKQVLHSMFSAKGASFRQVLLVPFPASGSWTVAFQTGVVMKEVSQKLGENLITVFVPTTPFQTSGFLLMVSAEKVIELDLSVDAALKLIISMGVVTPQVKAMG